MSESGLYSLAPVIITLALSIWSRNVVLGLFAGVFSGVLLLNGPNVFTGLSIMVEQYLVAQASNSANVGIIIVNDFCCRPCRPNGEIRRRGGFCQHDD